MRRLHLILGLVVVIVFLLTGQYMEHLHNRLLPDGMRMLYRSRHIYFLLAGILNLSLGLYMAPRPGGWRRTLQILGSTLIVLSPAFLLAGFFLEPGWGPEKTSIAPLGIFAIAIGTLLHLLSGRRVVKTEAGASPPSRLPENIRRKGISGSQRSLGRNQVGVWLQRSQMFIENPVVNKTRAPAERNVSARGTQVRPFRSAGARNLLDAAGSIDIAPLTGQGNLDWKTLRRKRRFYELVTQGACHQLKVSEAGFPSRFFGRKFYRGPLAASCLVSA